MKIEIKSCFTGAVLFAHETEANSLQITLEAAVSAGANLSGANLSGADLSGAYLSGADLSRANLRNANLSGADLSRANLRNANLSRANLRNANLPDANLRNANLSGADLSRANLRNANLSGADLSGAYLSGESLSGAGHIPVVPNIDAAILAAIGAGGELNMEQWHTCDTTHCRAGWAITLAGKAGAELEARVGPAAAGALIYAVSDPTRPVPDFFTTAASALADMRSRAV